MSFATIPEILEDLRAGLVLMPVDLHAGGIDDLPCGFRYLRPNAVAGDERDRCAAAHPRFPLDQISAA